MAGTELQDAWVLRVLGVDVSTIADGATPDATPQEDIAAAPEGAPPRVIWRTAKEAVDEKLEKLAATLRGFHDPDLDRIAEFGLFGLTRGEGVALNKALIEYEGAAQDRKATAGGKLRQAVAAYRSVLVQHPAVKQIDSNPFGINPAMRATLGAALDRIDQVIA